MGYLFKYLIYKKLLDILFLLYIIVNVKIINNYGGGPNGSAYFYYLGGDYLAKLNTVEKVEEIIKPYAEDLGLDIWDVQFSKEGADWYLRIFIDKDGGIDIDDCVDLTHAISKPLDDADPISQSYLLEVSSPGVERELTRDEHFEKYIGSAVMVRTIRAIDGVRDFNGKLVAYENKSLTVELQDGNNITVNKKETSYVKLDDFDINDFSQDLD